jgi:hypothetical protein
LDPISDFGSGLPLKPGSESNSDSVFALAPPHASGHCLVLGPISFSVLEVPTTTRIEQVHLAKISDSSHSFSLLSFGPKSFLPDNLAAHSSEALALGDKLCSLSGLSENGTPIVTDKKVLPES